MADQRRRPIKVITVTEHDWVMPEGGGGRKTFCDVDDSFRAALLERLAEVEKYFATAFDAKDVLAVAKVTLKDDALAKSHRPKSLFDAQTCPIIGVRGFGELLIGVSRERLKRLHHRIKIDTTQVGMANISTIAEIAPYTRADAVGGATGLTALRAAAKDKKGLKVRLFRHHDSREDDRLLTVFQEACVHLGGKCESLNYVTDMRILRLKGLTATGVDELADFVGIQAFTSFPEYGLVDASVTPISAAQPAQFPAPDPSGTYPVIGVVDTGTVLNDPCLAPWVAGRTTFVADYEQDPTHGSFVAGLAINSRLLNQDLRFPGTSAKIIDVVAVPKGGRIGEYELIQILRETLPKFPSVRYWNLSLNNTAKPCSDHAFSELAATLDALQAKHNVLFIVPTGNPAPGDPWHRGWPAADLGERDRICPPADSLRAVAVASIAHEDRPDWPVKKDEPSPFSRRGPGPVFLPKPELAHFGGNCDRGGRFQQKGIRSFDGHGNVVESIGTSYAAPLIANILANVDARILDRPSRCLVRALSVHSAALRSRPLDAHRLRYTGFGIPGDVEEILFCTPWAATMVFENELRHGLELAKEPFPIPPCMRSRGKVHGGFLMTLVYEPPCDADFGAEYCRSNIEVSLGTYDVDRQTGKRGQKKQVPEEPGDMGELYERAQIEHGFKWSPVKVFRREIPRGIQGDRWRLNLSLLHRSGFEPSGPQPFVLIVTLYDPEKRLPVYDETVAMMSRVGWLTQDLRVEERVRVQV